MSEVVFGNHSINIPDNLSSDWTVSSIVLVGPIIESSPDPQMLSLQAPRSFQSNVVMTMEQVDLNETQERYVDRQIDGLREAGVRRLEAERKPITLYDGTDGLLIEQIVVGPQGERVRQMQVVIIKDRLAYTLIASQLEGDLFEEMREQFREILLSFKRKN